MCLMNNQPINGGCNPCSRCSDYLNTCMPVIINGYIFEECDLCYCEWCSSILYVQILKGDTDK